MYSATSQIADKGMAEGMEVGNATGLIPVGYASRFQVSPEHCRGGFAVGRELECRSSRQGHIQVLRECDGQVVPQRQRIVPPMLAVGRFDRDSRGS
jgi:hypothetical protein